MLISDEVLKEVLVKESGEKLVDIRNHKRLVIAKVDEKRSRNTYGYLIRKAVAEKLLRIASSLPDEMRLFVIDAYRPLEVQRKMWKYAVERHGSVEKAQKYVANPDVYTFHSTGGTVDVSLLDKNGKGLDMGSPIHTNDKRVKGEGKKNREVLIEVMEGQGFVN